MTADLVPGTLTCRVCGEEFCLACGSTFLEVPAPHDCKWSKISELNEWEKNDPPPCFRCMLGMVIP